MMENKHATEFKQERAFTLKAVAAGMTGLFLIAAGGQITPTLASQTLLGGYIGTAVFFLYFLICLLWNPLCSRFVPRLRFNRKELAVIMLLMLVGTGFSWTGWMRNFHAQMSMVPQTAVTNPQWRNYGIMDFLNRDSYPNDGEFDEQVLGGFINGQNMDRSFFGLGEVFSRIPFHGWDNMKYWAVLFILISLMSLSLVLIVHRQWIRNEKLAYPIASIAESLLPEDKGHHLPALFRSQIFWLAFSFVFFIHFYNFLTAAFPTSGFKSIPLVYNLTGLDSTFRIIRQTSCNMLMTVTISFLIIGIAYFLPPALSVSVGLNGFVYLFFAAQVYEIAGRQPMLVEINAFRAGAYFAFIITLTILGRRYYGPLFLKALGIVKVRHDEEKTAVWGVRMFLLTALGTTFMFCMLGMDVPYAALLTLTLIIVYLVFTRIICEVGLPVMAAPFMPSALFPEMTGASAIGPRNLMAGGAVSGVFFGDLSHLLMPNLATGMKLSHDAGVKIRRAAHLVVVAVIIAFGIAFFVHLWQNYSIGIIDTESKTNNWSLGINDGVTYISRLFINGELDEAAGLTFVERIGRFTTSGTSAVWTCFLIGIAAVFFTGFMRTRFLWWPFHAVIFCIWKTAPADMFWASFLIGWLIRSIIVRLGGESNYLRLKPLFFGLIFGHIFAAGMLLLYGVVYYFCTGVSTSITFKV